MIRVDPKTKECPGGTKPCSTKTSAENTVCIEPEKVSECPITGVTLSETPVNGFTRVGEYGGTNVNLYYTKDADSLPITAV